MCDSEDIKPEDVIAGPKVTITWNPYDDSANITKFNIEWEFAPKSINDAVEELIVRLKQMQLNLIERKPQMESVNELSEGLNANL